MHACVWDLIIIAYFISSIDLYSATIAYEYSNSKLIRSIIIIDLDEIPTQCNARPLVFVFDYQYSVYTRTLRYTLKGLYMYMASTC